jgi:transposase/transposase IS204/IS1001/IS1096/IS1165 family protein
MIDAEGLVGTVFSGLSALIVEGAEDAGDTIVVRAGTRDEPVACPCCGAETSRVHGYHGRTAAGVPVDGRRVLVPVRVRRMRCPVLDCPRQAFREQVPGLLPRYQRRTTRLSGRVGAAVRELAGRAGSRLLAALGVNGCRHTALRALMAVRLPGPGVPRVLGIDDFALRTGHVYATILTGAETGRRAGVREGRTADVAGDWLKAHPGVEIVCRDGSGAYGAAVKSALPGAVQCGDRGHLWHLRGEAAAKEVAAHSACWAEAAPLQQGKRAETTLERGRQVHDLRNRGAGLPDCSRRPGLSLDTVKRYDRASEPERLQRVPKYRPALAGPYRDYLRRRREEEPGAPVRQLLREIRERGCPGSSNLLVRYINQGRPGTSARTSHRARRRRSCSPTRRTFPVTSARPRGACQPHARR